MDARRNSANTHQKGDHRSPVLARFLSQGIGVLGQISMLRGKQILATRDCSELHQLR